MTTTDNPLDGFRTHIANTLKDVLQQLSIALPEPYKKDTAQLALQLERGKSAQATFSLPIPKLKIAGNPADVAKRVAEKVGPLFLFFYFVMACLER